MALNVSDKEILCRVQTRKKKVANFRNSQKMPWKEAINPLHGLSRLQPTWDYSNEVVRVIVVTFKEEGMEVNGTG